MRITRNNYETFFLDYIEGRLDKNLEPELLYFLNQNPDLRNELEQFEEVTLSPLPVELPDKNKLKRPIVTNDNREEIFIAFHEGDLNEINRNAVLTYLSENPQYQHDFTLFGKAKISPDKTIIYKNKSSLKRIPIRRMIKTVYYVSSLAAAIIGLLLFIRYMHPLSEQTQPILTATENKSIIINPFTEHKPLHEGKETLHRAKTTFKKKSQSNNIDVINNQEIMGSDLQYLSEKTLFQTGYLKALPLKPIEQLNAISTAYCKLQNNPEPNVSNEDYLSLKEFAIKYLKENVLESDDKNLYKITTWDMVEAGVKGFNSLTRSNLSVSRELDEEGNMKLFAINSDLFSFETPIKK